MRALSSTECRGDSIHSVCFVHASQAGSVGHCVRDEPALRAANILRGFRYSFDQGFLSDHARTIFAGSGARTEDFDATLLVSQRSP